MKREPETSRANVARLLDWFAQRQLTPAVSTLVALRDTPQALRELLEPKATGKIAP